MRYFPRMATKPPKPRKNSQGCPPGEGTIKPAHGGAIGNPPYAPTDDDRAFVIENASVKGQLWTAIQLGINRSTLKVHFKHEIEIAKSNACAAVGSSLYQKAVAGDGASMRFFLITQGGGDWSPRIKHEHTGADGGPMQTANIDLTEFLKGKSKDELARADELLGQLLASAGASIDTGDLGSAPDNQGADS